MVSRLRRAERNQRLNKKRELSGFKERRNCGSYSLLLCCSKGTLPLFGGGARYTPTCGPAALVHLMEVPWVLSGSKKVMGIRRTR